MPKILQNGRGSDHPLVTSPSWSDAIYLECFLPRNRILAYPSCLNPLLHSCALTLHCDKLPHEDFHPAARASCLEDGRRSGPRREATRRVESIHAQELVQDDARDACRDVKRWMSREPVEVFTEAKQI